MRGEQIQLLSNRNEVQWHPFPNVNLNRNVSNAKQIKIASSEVKFLNII